jgi:NAD-dependent deacetylase
MRYTGGMTEHEPRISEVASLLRAATRVVVLTGAGISTESGIPDFRGPQGVWTKNPAAEKLSSLQHYMSDPEVRKRSWQARLGHPAWEAQPNAGPRALAELERMGRLDTLVTQNIDGLHQRAGNTRERVIEIHGTVHEVVCMACNERAPMERALSRVRAGEIDPPCKTCGGILKSATISFGQALVAEDLERAERAASHCDLLLALGSTLSVFPVAGIVPIAKRAGATVIIMNGSETAMDDVADVALQGALGELLPRVVARLLS